MTDQPRTPEEIEIEFIETVGSYSHDPLGYAYFAFPWGEDELPNGKVNPLKEHQGPREWQADVLKDIGDHLSNPETRFTPLRIAVASGHGIGKSALISMIDKWGMDTCEDCRVVITANTDGQLKSKTVPEVTKWANTAITSDWFTTTATAIYSTEKDNEKSWRTDFLPWSKDNSEAFQGLHNQGKRLIIVYDEGSGIDDIIWEVTEGALTDEKTEIIWIAFGNPTRSTGRFRECFRKYKHLWNTRNIDSRDVPGTNTEYLNSIVEQYGEDSDQAKIRVKGQFPNQSAMQLYPTDMVDAAWGKHLPKESYDFAPKIIGVDPAWEGDDDFVVGIRQGLYFKILGVYPKNTNDIEMANMIARHEDQLEADAVFIDAGYGTGIVSAGRTMKRNWQLVWFAGKSPRMDCVNMRAAMHMNILDLLTQGLALQKDQELYDEMVACETVPMLDGKVKLPPKSEVKKQIGRSPNKLDCLGITTAYPVAAKTVLGVQSKLRKQSTDYNPIKDRLKGKEQRDRLKRK